MPPRSQHTPTPRAGQLPTGQRSFDLNQVSAYHQHRVPSKHQVTALLLAKAWEGRRALPEHDHALDANPRPTPTPPDTDDVLTPDDANPPPRGQPGCRSTHATFTKSSKARSDEPVYELHRNGLVHGMLTNYNNLVVATKAWNRLFAVADWARSLEAQEREAAKTPDPTWKDLATQLTANAETKAALAEFSPTTLTSHDPTSLAAHPVYAASTGYLDAWKRKNYGHMARVITRMAQRVGPGDVRLDYQGHSLEDYSIESLRHSAAAICTVRLNVVVCGASHSPEMRWAREGNDGRAAAPNEDGEWRLMWWDAAQMTQDAD